MKLYQSAAVIAAMALTSTLALCYAADTTAPSAKWTQADVQKLCTERWNGKPKRYDACLKRQKRHIGKVKTPKDLQALNDPNGGMKKNK